MAWTMKAGMYDGFLQTKNNELILQQHLDMDYKCIFP